MVLEVVEGQGFAGWVRTAVVAAPTHLFHWGVSAVGADHYPAGRLCWLSDQQIGLLASG